MQGIETLGEILKAERERRGLSLDEVHNATKITVQNVAALEEDRFDSFPNKVYARAFLRDYSNFLGLDSAALLTRYEEEWCAARETPATPSRGGSVLKGLAYALVALILVGGLVVGGYFGWRAIEKKSFSPKPVSRPIGADSGKDVATLPRPAVDSSPKPAAPKPAKPKPETPVVPKSVKLSVKATKQVWVQIWVDEKSAFLGEMPKGQSKSFEGKKKIRIRSGMAGAVQLVLNDKPQPSLGSLSEIGDKEFKLPAPPAPGTDSGTTDSSGTKPANSAPREHRTSGSSHRR